MLMQVSSFVRIWITHLISHVFVRFIYSNLDYYLEFRLIWH